MAHSGRLVLGHGPYRDMAHFETPASVSFWGMAHIGMPSYTGKLFPIPLSWVPHYETCREASWEALSRLPAGFDPEPMGPIEVQLPIIFPPKGHQRGGISQWYNFVSHYGAT